MMMPCSKTDISSSFPSWRWLCKHTNSFLQVSISRRRWRWWVDSPFVCCESSGREQSHSNTRKRLENSIDSRWDGKTFSEFAFHFTLTRDEYEKWRKLFFNEKLWAKNVKILFAILCGPRPLPSHCSMLRIFLNSKATAVEWMREKSYSNSKWKWAKILCNACEIKEVARNRSGDERWAQGRRIETKKTLRIRVVVSNKYSEVLFIIHQLASRLWQAPTMFSAWACATERMKIIVDNFLHSPDCRIGDLFLGWGEIWCVLLGVPLRLSKKIAHVREGNLSVAKKNIIWRNLFVYISLQCSKVYLECEFKYFDASVSSEKRELAEMM